MTDAPVPHSIEAEQQILGALLTDNGALDRIRLEVGDFFDPVHGRIFEAASARIRAGRIASPVTLKAVMGQDEGLEELGGPAYLVRLAAAAISAFAAHDYANLLRDLRRRRDLIAAMDKARAALLAPMSETADVTSTLETALLDGNEERRGQKAVSWLAASTKAVEQVNDAWEGREPPMVPSGIPELDRFIAGFDAGALNILAGRPSMGKTGIALSIATRAAKAGHPVVFVSLEMMPEGIAIRGIAEQAAGRPNAVAYAAARRAEMTPDQYRNLVQAAQEIEALPITFLPRAFGEPAALYMGAKQAVARMGLKNGKMPLIVVDYLQLMKVPGASRYEVVTAISMGLKDTAMRMECPVLALSQLSRAVEQRDDKRPMLSDLRESGQLEQDADAILFAYRDEYYLAREEPDLNNLEEHADWRQAMEQARNRLEIIIAKQRQGEIGTARVRFNPALNLIWSDGDRL